MKKPMAELGFLPGWGNTVGRIKETANMALDLFEAPDASTLEQFLARMPNMFDVIILSPHG